MKTKNDPFVLQGRAEPTGEGSFNASVFTAFSMALLANASDGFTANDPSSTVLHVQLATNNTLLVYAKQIGRMACADITSNFTALSDTSILVLGNVIISRPNNVTFQAVYGSGISVRVEAKKGLLTVVFAGPMDLMGQTRGLMGVWDEDSTNDFTAQNGTVLPPDSSDRTIHFDFGLSCKTCDLYLHG